MKTVLAFILLVSAILAGNCGGNCPGNNCPSCPCGNTKKMVDIAAICKKHNWDQKCCNCIVKHESGGNAHAVNYNARLSDDSEEEMPGSSLDVGVFQINSINWSCSGGKAPCDEEENLKCAVRIYGGRGWKAWSTAKACGC